MSRGIDATLPLLRRLGAGAVLCAVLVAGSAGTAQAFWRHGGYGGYYHHGWWGHPAWGGYYAPPPVVYGGGYYAPGYVAPPPVVYGPGIGINLPGVSIGIE
jgi:hypothetical protein